jgi:hypothetical protein
VLCVLAALALCAWFYPLPLPPLPASLFPLPFLPQLLSAEVVCNGVEAVLSDLSRAPEAGPRLVEAVTAWTSAGILSADDYSPPVRDFLASVGGGDGASGGGGSAAAAGAPATPAASEAECVTIAAAVVASGLAGIPLAKALKEALKGRPLPLAATAVTRAVLQVRMLCVRLRCV